MMSKHERVPKFLDNGESNRFVYESILEILSCIERLRKDKVVSHRMMDITVKIIDNQIDQIMEVSSAHVAVDVKVYILDKIEGWIKEDEEDDKFENCLNLQKLSNILWKR